LNIIKVGNQYVNLDIVAHAYDGDDKNNEIILVLAVPDYKAVGGAGWVTGAYTVAFRDDEARQVREALDIAAAMNRWERAT
jgi:hypothetical protein